MLCGLPVLATQICGFSNHVLKAQAGLVCTQPFEQDMLNKQVLQMLTSEQRNSWQENARRYCEETDLYSLIERATDLIVGRSERNRALR